jgi:hypothetical protein
MTTARPFKPNQTACIKTTTKTYKICDQFRLQFDLDTANDEVGFATMEMVMEVLPLFACSNVLRVRGSLHSTKGCPPDFCKITEVILIQHHGLVVGEVSTLPIEDALYSPLHPAYESGIQPAPAHPVSREHPLRPSESLSRYLSRTNLKLAGAAH